MNDCGKYAEWIADAGLGALASSREAELLAHAAECDACRESYRSAHELAALVDRGVEWLVAGEPSPHFATRLRARMAEERSPGGLDWLGWKPVAAGAVTVAVLGVLIVSFGRRQHSGPAVAGLRADANSTERLAAPMPYITQAKSVPPGDHVARPHEQRTTQLIAHRDHAATHSRSAAEPEVLVQPGQLEAVLQFARAAGAGQIDGKELLAAQEEAEKPLAIEPLEIAPLNPPQPDAAPDAAASGRR